MLRLARFAPRAARAVSAARLPPLVDVSARGAHETRGRALGEAAPCCPGAESGRALRVVCCPPPAGRAPPCPAPPPPPPRTCSDFIKRKVDSASTSKMLEADCTASEERCGAHLDRVAHRIAAVERARRLDYEREVAARTPPPPPAAARYRLADERRCLRATDGRDYLVPSGAGAECAVCGPDRTPPPPRPVEIHHHEACEIHRDKHLDPCAHRPFVEIDRSDRAKLASPSEVASRSESTPQMTQSSKPSEGLTTRIIGKFKRGGSAAGSSPGKECRRKDDDAGRTVPPPKSSTPPRCGEPSLVKRLSHRPGESCGNSRREIHTKGKCDDGKTSNESSHKIGSDTQFNTDNLEKIFLERSQLKETGRGRTVGADSKKDKKENSGTGSLELPVPESADTVHVRVRLDFRAPDDRGPPDGAEDTGVTSPAALYSPERNDSWLSLKNFHKKITGCSKREAISSQNITSKAPRQHEETTDRSTALRSPNDRPSPKRPPKVKFSSGPAAVSVASAVTGDVGGI